jgi:hypothetical protein
MPSEEQHASAQLKITDFLTLSDLVVGGLSCPNTNIWNQVISETGTLGGYSSEADVNIHVHKVIIDILEALDMRGKVTIRAEVQVMRNCLDFMLILVMNGHPIGTIEGKQPGKDAMEHPNILGEVYDQLMHLHSIFRVTTPFAILTCYEKWRICWLDKKDSNDLAGSDKLPEHKASSPQPPPTPSRKRDAGRLQKVDDTEANVEEKLDEADDDKHIFRGTAEMSWNDKSLTLKLASVIKKMMLARQDTEPTVLRFANATTSVWKKAPNFSSLNFELCISGAVKRFFLWEDLGHGADGRAFLVSGGTKGAVGVLKFFYFGPEKKAQHEARMWKQVYSHLSPVDSTVRTVQVMCQTALLMPWFQCPERTKSTLDAVEMTLREDFMAKGIRHDDVAWRNVGIYYGNDGQTKAVVFDMQKVKVVENQEKDWVKSAVMSLSQNLVHE